MLQLDPLEGPSEEDSPDLTDEEISGAILTRDANDLMEATKRCLQELSHPVSMGHDLRRRGEHMYCRTRLTFEDGSEKVLVFQMDWVKG